MRQSRLTFIVLAALPFITIAAPAETITLDVQKMTCGTCPITVKKSLQKVPGVNAVTVDYSTKTARVTFDPDKVEPPALTAATAGAGYPSTVHK